VDKFCPETWCVVGNCFSLQREPEIALKYFTRALQVNITPVYVLTLTLNFLSFRYLLVFLMLCDIVRTFLTRLGTVRDHFNFFEHRSTCSSSVICNTFASCHIIISPHTAHHTTSHYTTLHHTTSHLYLF
jgi:hypothetical protein